MNTDHYVYLHRRKDTVNLLIVRNTDTKEQENLQSSGD